MILDISLNIENYLGAPSPFKFTQASQLGPLISRLIGDFIIIAAILVLIYLVWGGIQWITSGGEKGAITAAKSRISAALIGLLIVLASWAIFVLIKYMFGISLSEPSNQPPAPTSTPTPTVRRGVQP